jgi:hypothetical protein
MKVLADAATSAPNAPTGASAYGDEDPRDDFADRQAFRRDVRAALEEAQLDDVHDRGGNRPGNYQLLGSNIPERFAASSVKLREQGLPRKKKRGLYGGSILRASNV